MTRKEAISLIKSAQLMLINPTTNEPVSDLYEALEMAIQALSQEPCTDTVSIRKDILKCRVGKIVAYNVEWLREHWQMEMDIVCGVKPCDDAISRDMALEKMADYVASGYADSAEDFEEYSRIICQLPPVTPQKYGKWIRVTDKTGHLVWECDKCGWQQRLNTNFCPDCGAKMESEDKE